MLGAVGTPRPTGWFVVNVHVRGLLVGLVLLLLSFVPQARPAGLLAAQATPEALAIRFVPGLSNPDLVRVEVTGLSESTLTTLRPVDWAPSRWQRLLSVRVQPEHNEAGTGLPAMAGEYRVAGATLVFIPQFSFTPGIRYQAEFAPAELPQPGATGSPMLTAEFQSRPRSARSTTRVAHVYPSGDVLPENLLKFYVHFSAPMSRGHIYNYIHLREESGREVELPFLEIDEELWDPSMQRLTLFIDPGRIKRGVQPLEEVGPALESGRRYRLVLDRTWQDATGNPLRETFQKKFRVGPPDRLPPDPQTWKLRAPAAGSRNPVTVSFPEPLDHALALRVLRVTRASGEAIAGTVALTDQERRWSFTPLNAWSPGAHRLVVASTLEDLAGNNIGKPFEVDLFEAVESPRQSAGVSLAFEVR